MSQSNTYALYEPPHGRRLPGGQQKSFSQQALDWIDPTGSFSDDIIRAAQDWVGWRHLTVICATADR